MMRGMKYVMTLALLAAAMLAAPVGRAGPDPHKPDLGAHYGPGGGTIDMMSPAEPSCDGVPYDDGSYWRAINRGAPGTNSLVMVQCVKVGHWPQPLIPLPAPAASCQ